MYEKRNIAEITNNSNMHSIAFICNSTKNYTTQLLTDIRLKIYFGFEY